MDSHPRQNGLSQGVHGSRWPMGVFAIEWLACAAAGKHL
jgi:hypothetical protein